jgi:hypothetical protein
MTDPMRASGVEPGSWPEATGDVGGRGADVVTIHSSPSPGHGNGLAARIVAITIERFRARSISNGAKSAAIDAALPPRSKPQLHRTHPVDRPRALDAPANSQLPLKNLSRSAATGRAFACNQNERLRTSRSRRSPGITRSGQPTALLTWCSGVTAITSRRVSLRPLLVQGTCALVPGKTCSSSAASLGVIARKTPFARKARTAETIAFVFRRWLARECIGDVRVVSPGSEPSPPQSVRTAGGWVVSLATSRSIAALLGQPSLPDGTGIVWASCRCRIVRRAAALPRVPPRRRSSSLGRATTASCFTRGPGRPSASTECSSGGQKQGSRTARTGLPVVLRSRCLIASAVASLLGLVRGDSSPLGRSGSAAWRGAS